MDGNNPAQQRENLEQPVSSDGSIEAMRRAAKEIADKDPNSEYTSAIASLDVLKATPKDKEAITFMQSELINIMAKIAKQYPDGNLKEITPRNLSDIVRRSGLQLRGSEVIALSKLDELQMHAENPVTQQLNQVWGAMAEKADDAKMGIGGKYLKRLKEKPGETIIYTAAGAAGIYLGLKLIGWLAGKAVDKVKGEVKETAGKIFSTGNILAGLGLIAGGAFLGKDAIKDYVAKKIGITAGAEQLTKQLTEISEKISKAQTSEEAQNLKKQAEELIADAKKKGSEILEQKTESGTGKEVSDKIKKQIEEWQNKKPEDVPQEEWDKANRLSKFFTEKLETHINLEPRLLIQIGNQKYEEVRKNGGGKAAQLAHALQLTVQQEYSKAAGEAGKIVTTYSPDQFIEFLGEILKNNGNIDAFKNKTVYEVLEMIEKNQNEYIDQKALKESQQKKIDHDKDLKDINEIGEGNFTKEKFYQLAARLGRKGYSIMVDTTGKVPGWLWCFGVPVLKLETKVTHGILKALENELKERGQNAASLYVKVAKYTACIGAPIGSVIGLTKGIFQYRGIYWGAWEILSETVKYGVRGFLLPSELAARGVKSILSWPLTGVNPIQSFQRFVDQQTFLLDDLRLSPISRYIGIDTFMEKAYKGKINVSTAKKFNRLVWKLDSHVRDVHDELEALGKIKNKGNFTQTHINFVQEEYNRSKELLKAFSKPDSKGFYKVFDFPTWEKTINDKFKNLTQAQRDIFIKNPKLGFRMFDATPSPNGANLAPSTPQAQLQTPKLKTASSMPSALPKSNLATTLIKNPHLIDYLDANPKVLDILLEDERLLNDPIIAKAIQDKSLADFEKTIIERAEAWKKMDKVEIAKLTATTEAAETASKAGEEVVKTPTKNLVEAAEADAQALANPKTPGEVAAKKAAEETLEKAQALEQAEEAAKGAKPGSEAATKLAEAEKAVTESAQTTTKAIEAAGKTSKLWGALKFAGKVGGVGAAGLGSAVSTYEAGKGFYEAATTNVEGRAGIEATHASLLTVNAAADTALFATMVGAKGAAVKLASRAWAPLIPVTWAGSKVYESVKESNMTEFEWAQKYSQDDLIHQWFTTGRSVSEGDAILTGFKGLFSSESTDQKIDKDMENKREIAHKIYRVLVASQSNPELIKTIYTEKSSDEKDRKIESLIGSSYTKYHEYYFQQEGGESVNNYESARKFITNACAFNEIMQIREKQKAEGVTNMKVGSVNLMDERFDIEGSDKNVKAKKAFMPSEIVKNYKSEILLTIKEKLPALHDNLENIDTSYLLLLYVQIMKNHAQAKEGTDKNALNEYAELIRMSLKTRDINVDTAIQNQAYLNHNMSLDQLFQHLQDIGVKNSLSYRLFEKENIEKKPAAYAMYKLAQYFGYSGYQKESELQAFFNESKANFHGIYYKDGNWCVQKEGWDFDTKIGRSINQDTIEKMISELYQNADNILEHRKTGTFVTAYDFTDQVKNMARLLEGSYNEGIDKYEPKSPKIIGITEGNIEKKAA
jgi:hypothetical protein